MPYSLKMHSIKSALLLLSIIILSFGFGKNKVQYTNFEWQCISTPHFKIHTHQNQEILSAVAPYWFENAYRSLHLHFNHNQKEKIPVIIYGNTNLFVQTNVITELLPEEVGGFTELFKNRITIPFNGSYKDFRHVLHHELVHAFMFGILFEQFGSNMLAGNLQLPLWYMEGAAEYLSSGWDTEADMFMIDIALNSSIPPPGPALNGYLAYKGGQSFLFYLASSRGDSLFHKFLVSFKESKKINSTFENVYKKSLEELGKEWIRELKRLYWPEIGCRSNPEKDAKAITHHLKTRDNFNLRPRISPDGNYIAFFSDRNDYTQILITDTSGKIIHKISQHGYGGYFESFHPFRSGLCWSPDGERLAFVTKSNGTDEIRIVGTTQKKLHRRIRTRLNSISSPDWSRDGTALVFTAVDSGKNDLYRYRINSDKLTRLTNSVVYESDPRFSPDGSKIIFSIEDSSGHLPTMQTPYGPTPSDLALLDLSTGILHRLTDTPWSEKQPCFSPDGNSILFVSNRNGINNLYIGPIDSLEKAHPITNYTGGCTNPDWSIEQNRMVFSLFHQQGWDIRMMEKPDQKTDLDTLQFTRWVESFNDSSKIFFNKVTLPPESSIVISRSEDTTADDASHHEEQSLYETDSSSLQNASPPDTTHPIAENDTAALSSATTPPDTTGSIDTISVSAAHPYRLSFSPDMVSVGLGVSTVYSPAGQVFISLSDLMGDHRITFAGDLQGNFKDYMHLFFSYYYLKNRIDLGAGTFYSKDYALASILGTRLRLYHETEYGGFCLAQYPFSMFSRIEYSLLIRHIEQIPIEFSGETVESNIVQNSLSYVFDNILWGITGPLNGIRANATLQLSPPIDPVSEPYLALDADIRHYLHLFKRFVWANRLFVGGSIPLGKNRQSARRYLLGGSDQELFFHVNLDEYERNMRYTFYSEFITPFRGWSYVDLSGTRIAVFNSEFRFPFIREISIAWPLPIQIRYINGAIFTDIGNAWELEDQPGKIPLPGKIYGGFGFGMRANLGIFVVRFDRGWPTDFDTWVGTPINYFSLGAEF